MILKSLHISNFRNFEEIDIDLTNKNIIFGLNDIGKTNLLCALRFLLDRRFRMKGFIDTDFYNRNIQSTISITLTINIEDENDEDNKKIYSRMKGAISSDAKNIHIRLISKYNDVTLMGEPELFWGTNEEDLEEIPSSQTFFEIDKLFNVIYIDSSISLENEFKRYTKDILRGNTSLSEIERDSVNTIIDELNQKVGDLENIKNFENDLVTEYKNFRDENDLKISVRSEIELNNLHTKLTPYILNGDSGIYPTSGDGRKKILAYTIMTLENRELEEKKINIFLVEELENHLHRSMQIALSYQLFGDEIFKHLFITTHSSLIVSQMDNVNLIKLFKDEKITGKSYNYIVPLEYKKLKQKLNEKLAEAIFADTVLLIEGPSEKTLFERILFEKHKKYESQGGYMLEVDGIDFKTYNSVLKNLGIKVIIKTDNDLKLNEGKKEVNLLGLNRGLRLINEDMRSNLPNIDIKEYKGENEYKINLQKEIFDTTYNDEVNTLQENNVYLSRVDLENDLYCVISEKMDQVALDNGSSKNGIDYLQTSKLINMIKLCNMLDSEDCEKILNHHLFKGIKELVESCSH
ncbi:AAA family ATPase [Halobacillus sp. HZG1]|uniref:ATP-dependent nuclease n=1 Tax=Halobacillus sp. HZG1 TaxID=3111769 RepID=UPI002DBF0D94|nr:AAA family ATPase [Halobacillus sp. HZG1]MEC3884614.1 AAA family ATPase [Halobacillus sp. HZG1]